MVIFFEWHRTAMDQKSSSGLPMAGEDNGLGALASPLAGYLGKVQERAALLEDCPWCTSKGLSYALRSYRINFQESVTLCTNPQCLFPLVSRSLEDVLASLDPVESTNGNKRKNPLALEKEEFIKHSPKRLRSTELDSSGEQTVGDMPVHQVQHCAEHTVSNGQLVTPKTDGEKVNGYHQDLAFAGAGTTGWQSLQDKDAAEPENTACTKDISASHPASARNLQSSSKALLTIDVNEPAFAPHCGSLGQLEVQEDAKQVKSLPEGLNRPAGSSLTFSHSGFPNKDVYSDGINTLFPPVTERTAWTEQKSQTTDITTCKDISGIKLETKDLPCTLLTESEELVTVPNQLFWRNSDNLCWLDSLLTALVNCRSLRKSKPKDEPQQSSVWQMMGGYEEICAAIEAHQQTGRDGIARLQNHVLQKANADLQNLRMSVFKLLQPKLHCKLGERETPVFAMPLLLKMDSWVEPLFQSTFYWEFKCSECKFATKERVTKTLPTFTSIVREWHPLYAAHLAPCNVCCKKNQRRTMILEKVPPVFVLHFVEGLPDNDVKIYTFSFKGKRYSVTTIIQYNHQFRHFVTWIRNSDGSWLEYDDLKHPDCKTHQNLHVPAQEMHIVFWEIEDDEVPHACSPSSTCTGSPSSKNEINPSVTEEAVIGDQLLACTLDQSLVTSHDDTDIVCAFSVSEDTCIDTTITAGVDTSIGSTTLLDTFEGLSHNDIITLTLVELKADSETQPLSDSKETQDLSVPNKTEIPDSTPDSSSAVIGSEICHSPGVELATTSNSSDTEFSNGSSSDPTFVPCARRQRARGIAKGKTSNQKNKKAAPTKPAPQTSPPAASEPSNMICNKPVCAAAEDRTPPVDTLQTSPVSSSETSPLSTSLINPAKPTPLDQNARWSYLLSKNPVTHVCKSIAEPPPTHSPALATQVKPTPPAHSTPNPVRRQQTPGILFHKPQLRTEESVGLPLKAAEMYGAFGTKSSSSQSPLPTPAPLSGNAKLMQPITSHHQKSLMNTTVLSGTSLSVPEAKGLSEISSLKKHSSQSSKTPPGLSKTEALRYKLIKKLKAKKKALAKLNKLLGHVGETNLQPDSTNLNSPSTVTSSTYDDSTCEDFFSDLLSPATTASNLSPDSTSLLEKLAGSQDVVDQLNCAVNAADTVSQTDTCLVGLDPDNFLEEFLSQAVAERPTDIETEALSALEMFM